MPNILPPGAQTFLKETGEEKIKSALLQLYEEVMIDYTTGDQLTKFSKDLGFERPPVFFSDDDQWRAIVRAAAFSTRHTRDGIRRVFELIFKPMTTQVTVLNRTVYANILVGDTLTITGSTLGSNNGTYAVKEVRVHELVFAAGSFNKDDTAVVYSIEGTTGFVGKLTTDSQGNDILQDTTVEFVNTHEEDFLTKVNSKIPQYGKVIFNKVSTVDEESFTMAFYAKDSTGILKTKQKANVPRKYTRNKYMPIQSSFLASNAEAKSTTISIRDSTNFPANAAPAEAVTAGSDVLVIKSPDSVAGTYAISAVSNDTLTIGAVGGFTAQTTAITYAINVDSAMELKGTNVAGTVFGFQTGKLLNSTTFVDTSKNFSEKINASRYSVTLNRGEATEETVEVASRSGAVLTLASNSDVFPVDSESRLKYKHFEGESVEVANLNYSTTGSYFVLDSNGAVEGTADADSTLTTLNDDQAAFVAANESTLGSGAGDVVDGDEIEITDTSSDLLGKRVAVKQRNSATQLTLDPGFDTTMAGLKYKIRKKYKPTSGTSKDNKIYVADARGFPASNFSVILDRGKCNEEVLWISTNTMFSGTNVGVFTIANNENGTPSSPIASVTKEHDFGVTVEPAQVLIESCKWSIIETKATGEFTVAFSEGCKPDHDIKAFYIHEQIDSTKFTNAKATEPSVPLATTVTNAITNASTQIEVSLDDLNDKLRDLDSESPQNIFRSVKIVSGSDASVTDNLFLTKELTYTTIANGTTSVPGNYPATGDFTKTDTITVEDVSNFTVGDTVVISKKGSGTEEQAEIVQKQSITISGVTYKRLKLDKKLTSPHFIGDTVHREPAKVGIAYADNIGATSYPVGSKVSLLFLEDEFGYPSNLLGQINQVTISADLSTTVLEDNSKTFHPSLVGQVLVIIDGANAGEERVITKVQGKGNHQLVVGTAFSNAITSKVKYKIKSLVQLGDVNAMVSNAAGTAQVFNPIFAGSYVYAGSDDLYTTVDQPSHISTSLPDTHIETGTLSDGTSKTTAMFRIPAPQKLIATPKLSVSKATQSLTENQLPGDDNYLEFIHDSNQNFTTLGVAVDDEIEFLGPNDHQNYKQKTTVVSVENDNLLKVSKMDYEIKQFSYYRIHGKSLGADGKPVVALNVGATAPVKLYIDDATLFPRGLQNPFTIQVGDGPETTERFEVVDVNNQEGWIQLNAIETVQHDHTVGERVALEVKHLCINGDTVGWPNKGAIYLDYGSRGGVLCKTDLKIDGRGATVVILADGTRRLTDKSENFQSAYGPENKNALLGYKVIIGSEEATIIDVLNDNNIVTSSGLSAGTNLIYTIVSPGVQSLVDNSEPGSRLGLSGGILTATDVASDGGDDFPAGTTEFSGSNDFKVGGIRHGGAFEEYVEYSAKDGRVLTLKDTENIGRVFEYSHPSGTEIILTSGQFSTNADGSDHRPYLGGSFLEVILNQNITNLPNLLRAAGIEFKSEQTELGC